MISSHVRRSGNQYQRKHLKWVLPYCKPDLPRVVGALLLFIANNTMALTIPILSGIIVDRVIVGGHAENCHVCVD